MDNRAERLRGWLSPEGAEHFDDIVLTRKLGASPNIYAIGRMYRDLAENAPARGLGSTELVARVKELSGFFGELRGESSHADPDRHADHDEGAGRLRVRAAGPHAGIPVKGARKL